MDADEWSWCKDVSSAIVPIGRVISRDQVKV